MILLDSSCWIEYFSGGSLVREIRKQIKKSKAIIVPTLIIFEVYRKIARMLTPEDALVIVAGLRTHTVVDLTEEIALSAADISIEHRIGMADSCVLATARHTDATLITLDNDFAAMADVKVLRRP